MLCNADAAPPATAHGRIPAGIGEGHGSRVKLTRLMDALTICQRALTIALSRRRPAPAREPGDRHLLIVSFDFPPGTVTGAQLPAFLARHAARSGWRVTVICGPALPSPPAGGLAALQLVPEQVRIVRAGGRLEADGFHPQLPYRLTPKIDGGFAQGVSMTYAGLRALRADPPTHLFATGPTFNNFLTGRRLALHFDARLTLQYRDEWTVMQPSFVGHSSRAHDDEARALESADLVTFVTQGKADLYREAFPVLRSKRILVASNGWDPDILKGARNGTEHLGALRGKLILAFTGRVTEEIPIHPFLVLLAEVLDHDDELRCAVVLSITGDQTDATRAQLRAFAERHPGSLDERAGVAQTVATEILREASVLLLLNNTRYAGVVPLKTFDYMVADTPILAFGSVGEAGKIVQETGAGITVSDNDEEALRLALHRLKDTPKLEWKTAARLEWMERNNRERVCDQLLQELSALPSRH